MEHIKWRQLLLATNFLAEHDFQYQSQHLQTVK